MSSKKRNPLLFWIFSYTFCTSGHFEPVLSQSTRKKYYRTSWWSFAVTFSLVQLNNAPSWPKSRLTVWWKGKGGLDFFSEHGKERIVGGTRRDRTRRWLLWHVYIATLVEEEVNSDSMSITGCKTWMSRIPPMRKIKELWRHGETRDPRGRAEYRIFTRWTNEPFL